MSRKLSYGIDFGTTNSTIALVHKNDELVKIPIDPEAEDPAVMRSVIFANPSFEMSYGNKAVKEYISDIGSRRGVEYKSVLTGKYIKTVNSYGREEMVPEMTDIEVNPGGRLLQSLKSALSNHTVKKINLFGRVYLIEDLVGMFLLDMKKRADKIIGEDVDTAVIGRPVEYVGNDNELAIERMRYACDIAGFKKVGFEYEPIGAAYDYGLNIKHEQNVLIFDFGGGTLDISIVSFPDKSILYNTGLKIGGDYFDAEIFTNKLAKYFGSEATYGRSQLNIPAHIYDSLRSWYGITLLKNRDFANDFENFRFMCSDLPAINSLKSLVFNNLGFKLYEDIEKVKKSLTTHPQELFRLIEIDINIASSIARSEFENFIKKDITDIDNSISSSLKHTDFEEKDIDFVVTTGGSSLIPAIQRLLVTRFGKDKIRSSSTFTSVASGLAQIAKVKEF